MKSKILALFTVLIFILASCKNSDKDYVVVFKSDMDTQIAWTENPSAKYIKSPTSKSGSYICRMDSLSMYGPTFNMAVRDITYKKFSHVKISGWIKAASQNAEPTFVLDIKDANNNSTELLKKKFTGSVLNTQDWGYHEYDFDLSEKDRLNPSNIYRIYVYNTNASAVFCDDFEIAFY